MKILILQYTVIIFIQVKNRRPYWLLGIIIIASLPVFTFPTLLGMINPADTVVQTMAWFYLLYILCTDYLAWICWPERKAITWILILLLLLSHLAMWGLVLYEH